MPTYTKFAGTATTSGGERPWTNLTNISADDNTDVESGFISFESNTGQLSSSNYGFSIPQNEVIVGLKFEAEIWSTPEFGIQNGAKILKEGSAVGADLGFGSSWPEPRVVWSSGGATDLHGLTFTPDEVNDNGFGFYVIGNCQGDDTAFFVDFMRITVYTEVRTDAIMFGQNF